MIQRAALDRLLHEAQSWHALLPDAQEFVAWPDDLTWQDRAASSVPAAQLVMNDPGKPLPTSTALLEALQAAAPHVEWRLSYSEADVGRDFLNRYGWFELAGPEGHFRSEKARITVGYWGPDLFYPRHHHVPEELYTVVSGAALFHADGEADTVLGPGNTRFHASNQPHAMTTQDSAILTLVFWRGDGLNADLRMST